MLLQSCKILRSLLSRLRTETAVISQGDERGHARNILRTPSTKKDALRHDRSDASSKSRKVRWHGRENINCIVSYRWVRQEVYLR
jgi:hypothetical protein